MEYISFEFYIFRRDQLTSFSLCIFMYRFARVSLLRGKLPDLIFAAYFIVLLSLPLHSGRSKITTRSWPSAPHCSVCTERRMIRPFDVSRAHAAHVPPYNTGRSLLVTCQSEKRSCATFVRLYRSASIVPHKGPFRSAC